MENLPMETVPMDNNVQDTKEDTKVEDKVQDKVQNKVENDDLTEITCLCIGDPHFQNSNMKDAKKVISKIVKYAKKTQPDFIVCLGDILHTNEKINLTPFKAATYFLHQLSEITTTYLIIGNHDYKNKSQFLTDNHGFNALKKWKNMYVIDKVFTHSFGNFKFSFCPYVQTGRLLEALNSSGEMWELSDALFCHQEMRGAPMGSIVSTEGDEWDKAYPLIISGHIHDWCKLGNVFYTGSIMQHGIKDQRKKYLWSFTFKKDSKDSKAKVSSKKIDLKMGRKVLVKMHMDDVNSFDPSKSIQTAEDELVLEIQGYPEQHKLFKNSKTYKAWIKQDIKILFQPIQDTTKDISEKKMMLKGKNFSEILKDLVSECDQCVISLHDEIVKSIKV